MLILYPISERDVWRIPPKEKPIKMEIRIKEEKAKLIQEQEKAADYQKRCSDYLKYFRKLKVKNSYLKTKYKTGIKY